MYVKVEGPGTANLMASLMGLLVAATEACQAFSMKAVKEMQAQDASLQELHRRKQRLEAEVKALEERKKRALPQAKVVTKQLTAEEQIAHRAKVEADRAARKAEAEAKRQAALTHQPFVVLAEGEAAVEVKS